VPFSDLRRLGTIPATDFAGRVTERMTSSHPWRIRAVVSRLQLLMSHAITKPLVGSEERRPAAEAMVNGTSGFVSRYHVCDLRKGATSWLQRSHFRHRRHQGASIGRVGS
jgi:hypothetical protein